MHIYPSESVVRIRLLGRRRRCHKTPPRGSRY